MSAGVNNKDIAVVGYGVTGKACVEFLVEHGANVTLYNQTRPAMLGDDVRFELFDVNGSLAWFDTVVVSPGINPQTAFFENFLQSGGLLISDIELFAWFNTTPTIGITGSNGKTTVTEMLAHVLQATGLRVGKGGNVGSSALELLSQTLDVIVLELSSFQLQLTQSLALTHSVLLNLSEDHLDRHGNMQGYLSCKQNIFAHTQTAITIASVPESYPPAQYSVGNIITVCEQLPVNSTNSNADTQALPQKLIHYDKDRHCIYSGKHAFVDCSKLRILGSHNIVNTMVVSAIALDYQSDQDVIAQALYQFQGLPHRSEIIERGVITWINDSKATNVGATIAGLQQFELSQQYIVLIAGGDAKGASICPLKPYLGKTIQAIVGIGKDAYQFESMAKPTQQNGEPLCDYQHAKTLKEATNIAHELASRALDSNQYKSAVVLLSPACASLDMFKNYQQRGEKFAQYVRELVA